MCVESTKPGVTNFPLQSIVVSPLPEPIDLIQSPSKTRGIIFIIETRGAFSG